MKKRSIKKMTHRQAKRILPGIKARGDIDGDGIANKRDCRPFDPKKQGVLHSYALKRLRKKEQDLENIRIKLTKKLERKAEIMKLKTSVKGKKLSIQKAKLKQKQTLIDEINKERAKIRELNTLNLKIKKDLYKGSRLDRIGKLSKKTLDSTRKVLNDPKTRKFLKAFNKRMEIIFN